MLKTLLPLRTLECSEQAQPYSNASIIKNDQCSRDIHSMGGLLSTEIRKALCRRQLLHKILKDE